MKRISKVLSMLLAILMVFSIIPMTNIEAEAAALTQSQFNKKLSEVEAMYPDGSQKYEWSVNGSVVGWQCHGYGRWISWYVWGVDFANGRGTNWTLYKSTSSSTYIDNLVPGDVVRYRTSTSKTWNHTIFITGISGSTIYYTDCNSDGNNTIKWNQTVPKSTLTSYLKTSLYGSEAATYGYIAHYTPNTLTANGSNSCTCSTSYAGDYICTTSSASLNIRSGHGSSYSVVGSIPSGATVSVSKANGTWAHVTYGGVSGYASMEYLKAHTHSYTEYYEAAHPHKIYKKCSCGEWYYTGDTKTISSCSTCTHTHSYTTTKVVTAPTCTTKGLKKKFCSCGASKIAGMIDALGHDYTGERVYESAHPHEISQRCVRYDSCGSFIWTGENAVINSCSTCQAENPKKIYASTNAVNLKLGGTESTAIRVWTEGIYNNPYVLRWELSNSNVSCSWGEWDDKGQVPLTITANSIGSTIITLSVKDSNSGVIVHSIKINVNVDAKTYTVKYDANGGTGAPSNQIKYHNTPLTLSSTKPTRTGYTFLGWSTSSTATSATYSTGANFTLNGDTTLYAVWKPNTYTVKFNANGGTGTMSNQSFTYNAAKALTANAFTRTGYTFLGWSTSSSATSATYTDKQSVKNLTSTNGGTVTLYAVWKANTYSIKYNANGGSGTMPNSSHTYDVTKSLSSNAFTRSGYTFLGWSTSSSATSATYTDGQSVKNLTTTNGATVNLYAVWCKNPTISYTLSYNANGGTGAPSAQSGSTLYIVSSTIPQKAGYTFMGWSSAYPSDIADFQPNEMIVITANTTLYAVWQKNPVTPDIPDANFIFTIQEPSRDEIRNKDGIILHANVEGNAPAGSYVKWESSNGNFKEDADGNSLEIIAKNKGWTTFTAILYDADGNELARDSVEMYSKSGFFDKIGGFFRSLFGSTRIYEN